MVGRVLMGDDNAGNPTFRVSKPGYEVLTTTDPQNLIVDGLYPGLGLSSTGTVVVAGQSSTTVAFTNTSPGIPFVIVQQIVGSSAIGGGFQEKIDTTSTPEDTVPATRFYESTADAAVCAGLDYWVAGSNIVIVNVDTSARTFRWVVFHPAMAGTTAAQYDSDPATLSFTNISGTTAGVPLATNAQNITDIGGPVNLRLRAAVALTSGQEVKIKINGSYFGTVLNSSTSSATFTVQLGDQIGFAYTGTAAMSSTTFYVDNISTGVNGIASFTCAVTSAPDYDLSNTFSNTSTSTDSGGNTYIFNDTAFTVTGVNQTVSLTLNTARSMLATESVQVYKNSVLLGSLTVSSYSFTVVNGDAIILRHAIYATSTSVTMSLFNNDVGASEGSWTSTVTDTYAAAPDYSIPATNWGDISETTYGSATATGNTDTQVIGGINQTASLRLTMSNSVPSSTTIQVYKNGSLAASIGAGSTQLDFSVVNGDQIYFKGTRTAVGTYNDTGSVTNLSDSNAVLDSSIAVYLQVNSGPAP